MEQEDIDIAARIELARQQRSRALGDLLSADWKQVRHFIALLLRRVETRNATLTHPSEFIRFQCLP